MSVYPARTPSTLNTSPQTAETMIEAGATNDRAVDEYHRALKQCCNVERCQVRSARAQRNHIGMAIRAFVRLSWHFYTTGVSWYEAKTAIVREAIRRYRSQPLYMITLTA